MMKPGLWIKTMAASALNSPRAAFRKATSIPATTKTPLSSAPPIPLSLLATLTRVVQFLNDNHLEEEGLYSKPGVGLERKEILRFCKSQQLPDLSVYSLHSIASAIKEILSELYEPLIPGDISEKLLEAASSGSIDEEAEQVVTEIFKEIRSSTREFLQVFLGHLNSLASSASSRMSATNLALHIGIALVRPTEDKAILNSKNMMRRRKCVAEFLIHEASSLPYDCATEMNIPAIPELISIDASTPSKQLHFVQVTWDAGESNFTPEQLDEMFIKFGEIDNLGINDQGNRAIIAYVNVAGAEAAERASIPSVRVRRRKPRQGEKRREYSSHNPEHSKSTTNLHLQDDARDVSEAGVEPKPNARTFTQGHLEPEHKAVQDTFQVLPIPSSQKEATGKSQKNVDEVMVVEDIEDDQLELEQPFSDRSRAELEPKDNSSGIDTDDQSKEQDDTFGAPIVMWSDVNQELTPTEKLQEMDHTSILSSKSEESLPTKDESIVNDTPLIAENSQGNEFQDSAEKILGEDSSVPVETETELKANDEMPRPLSSATNEHQSVVRDSNEKMSSPETPSTAEQEEHVKTDAVKTVPQTASSTPEDKNHESTDTRAETLEQKLEQSPSVPDSLTESSLDLPVGNVQPTSEREVCPDSEDTNVSINALQGRLVDMEKILSTSTAALSATKLSNEFERAVLQLHSQILDMVAECLVLAGARHGDVSDTSMAAATNAEFLDFLEAQSRTQVKILEVEVRAGQELLRLHKTQYEKERIELEEEITALRVGRTEAERLCAELRTDLRKCRSELACHVANATDIQRQKSALDEKLVASENKLHAKEVALVKLQTEYDKMHRVAAEAQMRAEKFKERDFDEERKSFNVSTSVHQGLSSACVNEDLPHTSKLFSKISKKSMVKDVGENLAPRAEVLIDTPTVASQSSNVAALEAMKQQMGRDIQEQIATTRAALREMEICSSSGKTLEEEEDELRQLQQQLAAKSAEMNAAMHESRTKLKQLLDPTAASSFRDDNGDEKVSNQEPTIFDSTALVNELIARAEKTPAYSTLHRRADDAFSSYSDIGSNQQLSQYHRPTREAQSVLYKKWTAGRSRKMVQLASYRDQHAVLRAQQSMQTFQQALAEVREQR